AARFPPAPLGARPIAVLLGGAVLLVGILWIAHRFVFYEHFGAYFDERSSWFPLAGDLWWAACSVVLYLVLPAAAIRLAGGRLADFGLRWRGFAEHARVYLVLYLCVLRVVFLASRAASFQFAYPLSLEGATSATLFLSWE